MKSKFSSSRFFWDNNGWYFNMRGGEVEGPYLTKEEAESDLELFINAIQNGEFKNERVQA